MCLPSVSDEGKLPSLNENTGNMFYCMLVHITYYNEAFICSMHFVFKLIISLKFISSSRTQFWANGICIGFMIHIGMKYYSNIENQVSNNKTSIVCSGKDFLIWKVKDLNKIFLLCNTGIIPYNIYVFMLFICLYAKC